ncbi:saponin hydrolase precursor [Aspergillus steynii IBT 23096]|uniref:Saponin hydrolase n=1 Tax=Aspergillus steynii IBT 23096 TaxID=1392250 RepID=A0A2I2G8W9_9EURO|nr:saponin hydrolase precursor [Aspergillus steynii IBT 23096]PLB49324.1 saponin hydrolase precursor [Aspergillus steynii IBT 23096]
MRLATGTVLGLLASAQALASTHLHRRSAPPSPEPIVVTELPLPPVTPNDKNGSCTPQINPRRTGCMLQSSQVQSGNFLPDNKHVIVSVNFAGARDSIYNGTQLVIVKTDNTTFPNGDPWKCITCGVPEKNKVGSTELTPYPQAFFDGKRVMIGSNIVDCGSAKLPSKECTPDKVHIYPIRFSGGDIRELRIHPDNVHLGFNVFNFNSGKMDQFAYFGRLQFNDSSVAPGYDVVKATTLFDATSPQPISAKNGRLVFNESAIAVGELRGFSGRGKEVIYVGSPLESCNIDVFAADLTTGKVRRLTSHPEYVDPIDISPDDRSQVILDTRGTGRQMFMAGMRGIPPIIDMVVTTAASSTRNNGARRFFLPWLLDHDGDREDYFGQQINAGGDGSPGSINDPNWNAAADPKWSFDGTRIAYTENLVVSPACGGKNPLPCPKSTAPGGRVTRLMVAHLTSREPLNLDPVEPVADEVPWGVPFDESDETPERPYPTSGNYTLHGKSSGTASVSVTYEEDLMKTVAVTYRNYSDDGKIVIEGSEKVTRTIENLTINKVDWYSDLTSTGEQKATKKTSPGGFHLEIDSMTNIFQANGTLTTTVDGKEWKQPANGT